MRYLLALIPALILLTACGSSGGSSTPTPPVQAQAPDLAVTGGTAVPAMPTVGQSFNIIVTITNTGDAAAPSTTLTLYDEPGNTQTYMQAFTTTLPALPAGYQTSITFGPLTSSNTVPDNVKIVATPVAGENDFPNNTDLFTITYQAAPSGNG